jgi:hypothetical protein
MLKNANGETSSYGNFKNPFGLVWRMLRSGKRAAWSALFREGLKLIAKPADLMLSPLDVRRGSKASLKEGLPLILIVGPPRGGTTMVYQILANSLDVTCPNNLSSLFPRSSITMGRWRGKPPSDFGSYFGQTSHLSGVNDGFHIWNRWLGADRYRTRTDLSNGEILDMRRYFNAWTAAHGKPFLNKNNRNAHCIKYLSETLPNAYFVVVQRDPAAIARSLIRARKAIQGDKRIGWGLLCQETHSEAKSFGYVRDVCEQIQNINAQIAEQTATVDRNRLIETTYEEFCTDPSQCISRLIEQIPQLSRRGGEDVSEPELFKPSSICPLSLDEEDILQQYFRKWS